MADEPKTTAEGQTKTGRRPPRKRGSTRTRTSGTSPSKLRKKALEKRIFDMRVEGLTVRRIAERLQRGGFKTSKSEVQRILQEQLEGLGAPQETKEQARSISLERLDLWTASLFRRTKKGDEKAITTALRIDERRARYLGTDAPAEHQVKLTILGQLNWVFDMITKELGPDATQRVLRRIGEEGGPPAVGGAPGA